MGLGGYCQEMINARFSQNFIRSSFLVRSLISRAGLSRDDLILDIGAGDGVISRELIRKCKVVAFEVDPVLCKELRLIEGLTVKEGDFRRLSLPKGDFKVFSNIPFSISSDIIKRLLFSDNPPVDSFIVLQRGAALKLISGSMLAVLIFPFFKLSVFHEFRKSDFIPSPKVDALMLRLKKRVKPLVNDRLLFNDFIAFCFDSWADIKRLFSRVQLDRLGVDEFGSPSSLGFNDWLNLYDLFSKSGRTFLVKGYFKRLIKRDKGLSRPRRTSGN